MKQKLLVVTSTFPRWENDTDPPFVYELSKRLTEAFDVTVHTPHYPRAATREVMGEISVYRFRYFFLPFEKLAGSTGILPTLRRNRLYYGIVPFFILAQFCSLWFLVRKIRPDIIHAHWLIPQGGLAVLVRLFTGVPIVVTAHGADIFGLKGKFFKILKEVILRRVQGHTVVSRALAEASAELTRLEIEPQIIPMGVDSGSFSPSKKNKSSRMKLIGNGPFLLSVSRLTENKGIRHLIEAMPLVLQRVPDAKLLIIGSGELRKMLMHQVKKLEMTNCVLFAGSVPNENLPEYYANADIYIGPSIVAKNGDTEGFGLTFVEAAMSGCLVLASDIGGIKDIILDGETGFFIDPLNTQLLAEKICYTLAHINEFDKIRKESRRRCVEKFDWTVITRRYESLFKQVILS